MILLNKTCNVPDLIFCNNPKSLLLFVEAAPCIDTSWVGLQKKLYYRTTLQTSIPETTQHREFSTLNPALPLSYSPAVPFTPGAGRPH